MPYAEFETEVLGIVAAATGTQPANDDGLPQTLFTSVEAARLSIVEFMKDGLTGAKGRPPPPYVAVELGQFVHDSQWGVRSRTKRTPLSIAIVDATGRGATQSSVHDLAQAAADAIDYGDPFVNFQSSEGEADIDSSGSNPIFEALGEQSKIQIVAATVIWQPGLIVTRN